ncbi:MAG: glycoside hydrolase family 73 protein, partial [Peptostreptococcaceae bacterium]
NKYVDITDSVSDNKVQINWKNVVSIIGVINNNKFKKVDDNEIKLVAEEFINEDGKLNSIEIVMDSLEFNDKEVNRVYKYLEDLKNYGFKSSRLQPSSKYMQFINSIKEGAITNYEKYKILPSITIAQSILECGWGESELASKYNNLFGIKADKYWSGESIILETMEFSDTIIDDKFRVYSDKNQSIIDHGEFLYENSRYKEHGVFEAKTYKNQANALQNAGYSTLTNKEGQKIYANRLIEIIQQYNLQLVDSEIQSKI